MKTCEWCGNSIATRRTDAKYCSGAHRVAAHRQQQRNGGIPTQLTKSDRWLRWKPIKRNGTTTKMPITLTGQPASSSDPETWSSWNDAKNSALGAGLGYVLGDGVGCIDLDKCYDGKSLTPEAQAFIEQHPNSYIEISPSGNGLHIWGLRDEQPGTRRVIDGLHIETYSAGRYITVTGNVYQHGGLHNL